MLRIRPDRARAAAGVAALHLLLGWALITGLRGELPALAPETMRLLPIPEELPPPEVPVPDPEPKPGDEGAAAPPSRKARPTPVVAPEPAIRLPTPPVPTAPKPLPLPTGNAPSAGASTEDGPGTGAGGEGAGSGSGRGGDGTGGGGLARRAERIAGGLRDRDYPRSALRERRQGTVHVRFTVGPDGRVGDCTVLRSSGHSDLDSTTCRLIEQRFRYRPARDSSGRAIAAVLTTSFDWVAPFSFADPGAP
jgi:protein TonB